MTQSILRLDASPRKDASVTRKLTQSIVDKLTASGEADVLARDLSVGYPVVTSDWIDASFTPEADRSQAQIETLAQSTILVEELQRAETIVVGLPIYNFSVPASFKTWIDQITRAGVTFKYTENGPVGLLSGKRVIVAVGSGGTEVGSAIDFATGYVRHIFGFIGIDDVSFVRADRMMVDADASMQRANDDIEALVA